MEQQKHKSIDCLNTALRDVHVSEQTQELRLSDGMPDIGRVICAWGQAILRSKEWHSDHIAFSGGMMIWVLYAPEDGTEERCVSTWIPFQNQWDLPEGLPEGTIRIQALPRFSDARSVSSRKMLIRAGISVMAEAFVPENSQISAPDNPEDGICILLSRYPVQLQKEAGEKTFLLDEELSLPDSAPKPQKLMYCCLEAASREVRVLADKLAFRGTGNLHMLYRSEDGQMHSWDFEIPFSQFAQLKEIYGSDAQGDIRYGVTSLEPELDETGKLRLKGGVVAQYLITDRQMLELVEDAYSPTRELKLHRENLQLPVLLDRHRTTLHPEQTIPAAAQRTAEVRFLPDFPRQRRNGEETVLECSGGFQVLYYAEDGMLRSGTSRWDGRDTVKAAEETRLSAVPMVSQARAGDGTEGITLKAELPMEITSSARQEIAMVTDLEAGTQQQPDPGRPSLILIRSGGQRLWDIAKENGSTMEAIRQANDFAEEPAANQMLLIPVV